MTKSNAKLPEPSPRNESSTSVTSDAVMGGNDNGLMREVIRALRTIQYGSIVLTIHNGQLVEVSKNIRIRKSEPNHD